MKKTKVLFLFDKPADLFTKEDEIESLGVFAYLPDEMFSYDGITRTCYAHIGQHSACHPDYAKECKEADYDSYNDLKIELEGLGYKLDVLNKDFARQDAISKGKVWQVRWTDNDTHCFEGNKTACLRYLRTNNFMRAYKDGRLRLGKVIYEPASAQIVTQK